MSWKRFLLPIALSLPLFAVADDYPRRTMALKLAPYDISFRDYNFPSGLRVIFQKDTSQPIVSITYVNDKGSTADPAGKEGIAHLVEHLWFRSHQKGPDGKPLPKIWDMLAQMGAQINAFTADDQTVYMTMAPKEHLAQLIRLERLRMISAIQGVEEEVALIERDVVRNELRMRYENSTGAAFGFLSVKLFPQSHPYGRVAYAGIGSHASLDNIQLADIQSFVNENYGPSLTTIVVAGDIDLDKSWELLRDNLGFDVMADPKNPNAPLDNVKPRPHLPIVNQEPPAPVQPAQVKGELAGFTIERGPVQDPFIMIGWALPPGWKDDQKVMEVAVNSLQSAIYQELSPSWDPTSADLPSTVGCGMSGQVYASIAYCGIDYKKGDDPKAIAETALNGLYRAWTNSEDSEIKKYLDWAFNYSKNATMAGTFLGVDSSLSLFSDQATAAAMYAHYTGDLQFYSRQFEALNKVDKQSVQQFAAKYLNRNRAVVLAMEPYEEGDLVLDSSNSKYRGGNRADGAAPMLGADKLTPEIITKSVHTPDISRLQESTLPNGLKVVVMPYSASPLLQGALVFKGGATSFDRGQYAFASSMRRDQSYAVDTIAIAGFDGIAFGNTTTSLEISASVANLEESLYVLRQRVDGLLPDTNGKLDWAAAEKKSLWAGMKQPEWWAGTLQMQRLLPGHFLSDYYTHADYEAMKKWTTSPVQEVFQNIFRPENGTLLLVGNFDAKTTMEAANTFFAGWTGWGKKPEAPRTLSLEYPAFPAPPAQRQVLLFDKKISSQSNITYMCQLAKVTEEQEPAVTVLGQTLDGAAWLALREETGASYGANAFGQVYPGGYATLGMGSLVQNNFAAKAVKTFIGLGEKGKAGDVDPLMVITKQYGLAQEFAIFQQATSAMLGRMQGLLNRGRPMDYYQTWAKRLGMVNIPTMKSLMEPCVGHEVITVVGPVEVIKPLFDEANIPVEIFDWDKARLDYAAANKIKLAKPKKEDEKKAE